MTIEKIINKAKKLLNENKLEDAIILFKNILKEEPNHYKAHTNIGAILLKLEKFNEAKISFNNAIEINPEFAVAHYNLGIVNAKLNDFENSAKNYTQAIKLNPNYFEAYNNLGSISLKLGKLDIAEKNFKKVLLIKPEFGIGHYNLGCVQEKLNKFEEAERSYKKAIDLKPNYLQAQNNLNRMIRQNKLLINLNKIRTSNNKKAPSENKNTGLTSNPFTTNRKVETELIDELYKIDSTEIDNTKDIRYGNGKFSDYELFENNSSILKLVEKDLTDIIKQAVNSDIFIIDSFFNILRTGSGLASHHHINDFDRKHKLSDQKYSLTYYLCVGDQNCNEPGILKLYEPNEEILPSEGTIVIFPANRYHSAVYGGKTDRLMIGVNFYSLI